jgi:YD repeat-containing protein
MKLFQVGSAIACILPLCGAMVGLSQSAEKSEDSAIRVTVSMKPDGSRTVYEFDYAQHKAIATTTNDDGKLREKIHYDIDNLGRFSSGRIFGPDGRLRFKSQYKYDSTGRLQEETQSAEDGTILHRIVYSYDSSGKQTGYSIFDTNGKLIGRISAPLLNPTASPKPRAKTSR